jgi:hypothetical protein
MANDTAVRRTRREILAATFGGLAAWVASGLAAPQAVRAHDADDVALGDINTAAHSTVVECLQEGGPALAGHSALGDGVSGQSDNPDGGTGVSGLATAVDTSSNTYGIYGESAGAQGIGVYGVASAAAGWTVGVWGDSASPDGAGLYGSGGDYGAWGTSPATGLLGSSGAMSGVVGYSGEITMGAPPPAPRPKTGVLGISNIDASARGVTGSTTVGTGVRGEATSGTGVYATTTSGTGLVATATTGTALKVTGKAVFSRSKRVTIATGMSSLKVTLAGVTTSSLVFAVLHSYRSGLYVQAVVPTTGAFTIYLNKAAPGATYVAYFVLN